MSEITHVWGKHLPHHSGREKSFIEVTSREVMPDGRQASRRPDFWLESKRQINTVVTGMVYHRMIQLSDAQPTRNFHFVQYDAESSSDRSYNLADNNPKKSEPRDAFVASVAVADMWLKRFVKPAEKIPKKRRK